MKHYILIEVREPVNDRGEVRKPCIDTGRLRGLIHRLIDEGGFDCATAIIRQDKLLSYYGRPNPYGSVQAVMEQCKPRPSTSR